MSKEIAYKFFLIQVLLTCIALCSFGNSEYESLYWDSTDAKTGSWADSINEESSSNSIYFSKGIKNYKSIKEINDRPERKTAELKEHGDYIKSFMEQFNKKKHKKGKKWSQRKTTRMSKKFNVKKGHSGSPKSRNF